MEIDANVLAGIVTGAVFVTGAITWYVKGYVTKKAENHAAKEDIEELTALQKKVESNIADEAWHRQQNWTKKEGLYSSAFDVMDKAFLGVYKLMDLNSTLKGKIMLRDAEGQRKVLSEMEEGRTDLTRLLTSLRTIQGTLSLHSKSEAISVLQPLAASLAALSNPVPFENHIVSTVLSEAEQLRSKFQQLAKTDLESGNDKSRLAANA